jgi:uncharacterized protein (TIGR03437 family)
VAVDKSGNIYILDSGNWVVRKVTSSGTISTIAGNQFTSSQVGGGFGGDNGLAINGQLSFSSGVAVDSSGNIFIADTNNNRIRKVDTKGVITTVVSGGNAGGTAGNGGDGSQGVNARVNGPQGLAVDAAGNLYIADTKNNEIRKLAVNGVISRVAGSQFAVAGFSGDGGPALNAQLNHPEGVAIDAAGNIYIADTTNSRIRMVSPDGTINTIAGNSRIGFSGDGGLATSAALNFPSDVAVDAAGNVYVADYQNQVIRQLTPSGPAAGGGGAPSIASGGVVSAAAFGGFTSIAPGSWIEIYGSNFSASAREWAGSDFIGTNAPTALDRTSVTIGGQQAFVRYISPGQVNAQVPSTIALGQQQIVVSSAVASSAAYNITVSLTQPGLLAPPSFKIGDKQYVVAQFPDGTYVLPTNAIPGVASRPAKPGETIILYGIGFGPVSGVSAGQIAPASSALIVPPQISFGPSSATLAYAGLAGGFVGLYQFNVVVPNVAANAALPLTFTLSGTTGQQALFTAVGN